MLWFPRASVVGYHTGSDGPLFNSSLPYGWNMRLLAFPMLF